MTVHQQRPYPNKGYQRPAEPPVQSSDYKPAATPVTTQPNYVLPAATNVKYEAPLRPDTSYVAPEPETSYVASRPETSYIAPKPETPKPEISYVQPKPVSSYVQPKPYPSYVAPIQDTSYAPATDKEPSLTETSYPLLESYHAPPAPLPTVQQSYVQPAVVYQPLNKSSSNDSQQAPVIYIIQLHT